MRRQNDGSGALKGRVMSPPPAAAAKPAAKDVERKFDPFSFDESEDATFFEAEATAKPKLPPPVPVKASQPRQQRDRATFRSHSQSWQDSSRTAAAEIAQQPNHALQAKKKGVTWGAATTRTFFEEAPEEKRQARLASRNTSDNKGGGDDASDGLGLLFTIGRPSRQRREQVEVPHGAYSPLRKTELSLLVRLPFLFGYA